MSITFPRAMPVEGVSSQAFEMQRVDYLSGDARGKVGGVTAGFPLWRAEWSLGDFLTQDESDEWRAWVTSLRGAQKSFYGYEYGRDFPRAYPNGFGALGGFTGTASSWSQTIDGNGQALLTLLGLAPNLVMTRGDYVGFKWGGTKRFLVRLQEPATANASGALSSVTIEPPIQPNIVPVNALAHLDRPTCTMKLITSATETDKLDWRGIIDGGRVSAIQDLVA